MIPVSNRENLKKTILKHFEGLIGYKDILKKRSKTNRKVVFLEILSAVTLAIFIRIFMVQTEEPQIGFFDIAVQPQMVGSLREGLELVNVSVNPNTVRIYQRLPAQDAVIKTSPIYMSTITENTTLDVTLIAPPHVEPASHKWPEVSVSITVKEAETEKETNGFFSRGPPGDADDKKENGEE